MTTVNTMNTVTDPSVAAGDSTYKGKTFHESLKAHLSKKDGRIFMPITTNNPVPEVPEFKNDDSALDFLEHNSTYIHFEKEDLLLFRKALRIRLLQLALIGNGKTNYMCEFSGSGDSGSMWQNSENKLVDLFLDMICTHHVDFDWYNNDGGDVRIEWDISQDIITINGSQNETISNDVMVDVQI